MPNMDGTGPRSVGMGRGRGLGGGLGNRPRRMECRGPGNGPRRAQRCFNWRTPCNMNGFTPEQLQEKKAHLQERLALVEQALETQ